MDQHIDLSLADSMGYYRGNDIMIKVSPGRASPLEKRSAQRKEGGNLPGEMPSPPMPSFSAYNWDYEEEEKEVKKNYQVKAERQKVRKQPVASLLKDFASVTDLKKETRAREKMQRNIEDMRRYFRCWIKRDSVARKYACVKMQRWYRGSLQRKKMLRNSGYPDASEMLISWANWWRRGRKKVVEKVVKEELRPELLTFEEIASLRAEVRAATEIAAVSKYHTKSVEDENKILRSNLETLMERHERLEELVQLLLKEVSVLSKQGVAVAVKPDRMPDPPSPKPSVMSFVSAEEGSLRDFKLEPAVTLRTHSEQQEHREENTDEEPG
ncbi:hypothetical protein TL16_g04233 [Triparma laevis f. inornata]|uniref:Uncharacterized protein n=2 Tax=Triparma laevis TaxID=1534972 RepID=A0A9W6ZCH9_9STRA|nr:hypothetical protein TrLO_g991 [Triparma laevis f. longispina]GMH65585.1 hypothetical protein TL16_g04233 [Triparma laevis f. inornata]